MKLKFILIPILIPLLLLIILTVIDFTIGDYIEISVITQTYVPLTCKMDIIDTHGARNEGETNAQIYLTEKKAEKFLKKIKQNPNWKEIPMYEKLQARIENLDCFDENVPIAKNGYWFFYNRHDSFNDRYSPEEKFSNPRNPDNFSVAIFDTDTNILSYYELDT